MMISLPITRAVIMTAVMSRRDAARGQGVAALQGSYRLADSIALIR